MFSDSLYAVLFQEASDSSLKASIKINPEHSLYQGHFPGLPVTPGVVQLQIIKEILENQFQSKLKMAQMRSCKFLQIINPFETPFLQIELRFVKTEVFEVTASIRNEETIYLKAQVSYSFCEL